MKFTGKIKSIIFDLLIPLHSLSIEEKGRRKIFLVFSILLIVPLILFGTSHIIDGNYIYGISNYIVALILIILLITLIFQKNGKHIYRIAIISLGILLFCWIQRGGIQGYSSIFVLTFPLFAFFLMGRKEGFFWTFICFLFTILIFVNPSSLFTDFSYPSQYAVRHLLTFTIIFIATYSYESVREKYKSAMEAEQAQQASAKQLRKLLGGTVQAISMAVEARDPYTSGHQRRVADLARAIATEMDMSADRIDFIRTASTIHDIGKISVPAEILSKPTKLLNIEFSLIKTHAQGGYEILKDIDFPWAVAEVVLQHHERMDGSGYPNGLKGNAILLEARILAVADVVEAMASNRPYRPALGIEPALEEITKNKGVLYDPEAVDACLRLFKEKNYKMSG